MVIELTMTTNISSHFAGKKAPPKITQRMFVGTNKLDRKKCPDLFFRYFRRQNEVFFTNGISKTST